MDFNVIIPQPVHDEIDAIYHYLAIEKCDSDNAVNVINSIYKAIRSLDILPARGAELSQGKYANQGFRWIPAGNYIVVYEIKERDVIIQTVRHFLEDA